MACSRGRKTCTVHTPDKAALLDRLPSGNREAALDTLKVKVAHIKGLIDDRWGIWTKAQERLRALQMKVGYVFRDGKEYLRNFVVRAHQNELGMGHENANRKEAANWTSSAS